MKFRKFTLLAFIFSVLGLSACQKEEDMVIKEDISQQTLDKIYQLGFGTREVQKVENGYLVEGDILLTEAQLNKQQDGQFLRVGEAEQYRTSNLVTALPRQIRVSISSALPSIYVSALDEALARYNARKLKITFKRVTSSPDITIAPTSGSATYLAMAGFPADGDPFETILVNPSVVGSSPGKSYLATILAHEIGHCIGFRHTDFQDRSYSCGGALTNEGAASVGAIRIPGTPSAADAGSWMLACIGSGVSRPFNSNDKIALDYIY